MPRVLSWGGARDIYIEGRFGAYVGLSWSVCVCVCVCGEGGREGGEVVFDTMIFNSVILPHVVSRSEVWLDSYTSFLVCVLEDIPWWSKLHVSYFPFAALMVRAAKMYPKAILPSKLKTSRHAIAFWSSEKVWERINWKSIWELDSEFFSYHASHLLHWSELLKVYSYILPSKK